MIDVKERRNTIPVLSANERLEALNYILDFVEVVVEYELPKDIEITKVELFGSRINGGCIEGSDLDVLIEYRNVGDAYWKESHIFNIFCGDNYYRGIKLDFFPVLID